MLRKGRTASRWTSKVQRANLRHATERSTSCLPSDLTDNVPSCALSCVDQFVVQQYSSASCSATSQLDFLCTQSTPSGFTIGEAALQCLVSDCTDINSKEGPLYNICSKVSNAVPEMMATITATVAPSPNSILSAATLPSSITNPLSLDSLVSIVTASGTPSFPTTFPVSITSASNTPTTLSTASSANLSTSTPIATTSVPANPESAGSTAPASSKVQSGLNTGEIAGIAVACVSVSIAVFVILLCMFCLRKKRKHVRPLSKRWSTASHPHRPSLGDQQRSQVTQTQTPTYIPNTRFYATAPVEEKRRSFWRKSIKPDEIGVAVSPEVKRESSPASSASHKTASKLLPALPAPTMWPAPPEKSSQIPRVARQQPQNTTVRLHEATSGLGINSMFQGGTAPYETRIENRPPPSSLGSFALINSQNQAYNAERTRAAKMTGRIPLTPVYDNGNFGEHHPSTTYQWAPPQPSTRALLPPPMTRAADLIPRGLNVSASARNQIMIRRSAASESTAFEDETPPEEEEERQLQLSQSISAHRQQDSATAEGGISPIKNLAYPRVPRPAAVSAQAESVPRPIPASESSASLAQRRAEQWKAGQQKDLRIRTAAKNPATVAMNHRWQVQPQLMTSNLSPTTPEPMKTTSPKSRVTPKANARGDLYLTVED